MTGLRDQRLLGAQLEQKVIGGVECWTMDSEKYVRAEIANVEAKLHESEQRLPTRCGTPMQANYRPELDITAEMKIDGIHYYQELIGVLRLAVGLGRIDITMEVSWLSSHLALPRKEHLQQVHHMFEYLKAKPKKMKVLDPTHPDIDKAIFESHDGMTFTEERRNHFQGTRQNQQSHKAIANWGLVVL